jgi:hypothetical protein
MSLSIAFFCGSLNSNWQYLIAIQCMTVIGHP